MVQEDRIPELKSCLRDGVPYPDGLHPDELVQALNQTELLFERFYNLTGIRLSKYIQKNNLSGMISNILTKYIADNSEYEMNPDETSYPDLLLNGGPDGLEIKVTNDCNKGGEAHNGHGGWYLVATYRTTSTGGIRFTQVLAANLIGYDEENSDWRFLGSSAGSGGSQRTETYVTTLIGTNKLRDGMLFLDKEHREKKLRDLVASRRKVLEEFGFIVPKWSPFIEYIK